MADPPVALKGGYCRPERRHVRGERGRWPPGQGPGGIYNRRNIAGTSTKSLHSVGRAWDIGWETGFDAATLAGRLAIAAAFCGISEVIYFHRRWTAESGWQPYHGEDGHTTHIHVGFTKAWAYSTQPLSELQDWAAAVLYP
jgi:hypothetical protein